jgi:hypothetical protein
MRQRTVRHERQLVYGVINDSLVFLPKRKAHRLARLWEAITAAKTWGELRAMLPRTAVREIRELYMGGEAGRNDVLSSAPFDYGDIGAISEGNWPDWPQQLMLDFMPKEVVDEYGQVEDSMHNGEFLKLDPTKADEMIARLRLCGFAVEEDKRHDNCPSPTSRQPLLHRRPWHSHRLRRLA